MEDLTSPLAHSALVNCPGSAGGGGRSSQCPHAAALPRNPGFCELAEAMTLRIANSNKDTHIHSLTHSLTLLSPSLSPLYVFL